MIVRVINELMTPIDVVIPYGEKIAKFIPTDKIRVQRDNLKLIAIVKTIASLYRYQRLKITFKGQPVVVANLDDLHYALLIAGGIIGESMTGFQKRILYFHEKLKQKIPQDNYEGFTSKDASKATGHSLKTCQKYLKELCDTGHLESTKTEGKKQYQYFFSKKIIIPQLTEILNKIGEDFFTVEDFRHYLQQINVNLKNNTVESLYRQWKGKGKIENAGLVLSDEIKIETE